MSLHGKNVLITAGAQGIGLAITQQFIAAGSNVAVHYFASDEVARALVEQAQAKGLNAVAIQGDLTDPEAADKVVGEAANALGGLQILVNNAGSMVARKTLQEVDMTYWEEVFALNMTSAQCVTQAAIEHLLAHEDSAIINLSSIAGRKGGGIGGLAYSSAKGAMLAWTRALANELGPKGVRVNAVAPGLIVDTTFHARHSTEEAIAKTIAATPLQKPGLPDDVARAVVFLASEYTGFITGATLDINGGIYCA